MNKSFIYLLKLTACALLCIATGSCTDTIDPMDVPEAEESDAIVFTTMVPDVVARTRATAEDDWKAKVDSFKPVERDYTFKVEMWKEGADEATASSTYVPDTVVAAATKTYSADGTLQLAKDATPLFWQDNVSRWGFRAETVNDIKIATDQSTEEKWFAQDKLVGYSYLPIWDCENQQATDDLDRINYRTSKQWYADNQAARELSGLMPEKDGTYNYKKIPLYMQHQRSWVTIILKAGEGVTREALAYETSATNIKTTIYSYPEGQSKPDTITKAWSREEKINYEYADKNGGPQNDVSTTRYDAIVEPHNFLESKESQENHVIARINVSNQNFTFAAANDFNYSSFIRENASAAVKDSMSVYNLQPGKHLTITATLSRASRLIFITAWIEDWTETVTQTICDDYGQNGDPILINNRYQLIEFLKGEENIPGNVGLIVPNAISLADTTYEAGLTLKGTLNLAGSKLTIGKQFIDEIERTGSIVNGSINVADSFNDKSAIANKNAGTIERVHVTTNSETTAARATAAGFVEVNNGTIYQCSSALPVNGTGSYVGGIAAQNLYETSGGSIPVIDACTVTARVDGTGVTAGGGIVGQAEGRVSNNKFEYGITLLQNPEIFKNIIGNIGNAGLTQHSNNSWPTTEQYTLGATTIVNSLVGEHFTAIVDNTLELKTLLTSAYNNEASVYRVANSFSVAKENWIWGNDILNNEYFAEDASGNYAHGNVKFKLNGNDKTITLTGDTYAAMLFGIILGEVKDLNIALGKPIVADRIMDANNSAVDTNTDAAAAFAYSVNRAGKISNITLKAADGSYIEASTPGGIAVWVSGGGTITNCASNVPVRMNITSAGADARRFAGGIVACAEKATIMQCKYYGGAGSVGWKEDSPNCLNTNCRYGGIVGGTSEIANSENYPNLVMKDCYSWWALPTFDETVTTRPTMGSLIGSTVYYDPNDATKVYNGMAEGNAGNWWTGTTGAGNTSSGVTEEKAIGRKNSVVPMKPTEWQ